MKKIGLALSGGGFRASLYHLGLARFLRDAGILPQITHITSVSGGSIFAAHLVQNWARYNGSPNDFDGAAAEFLRFMRMDVRNRVMRRFPFMMPVRMVRRLLGYSTRKYTMTGLLEQHYEKYLYGDTSLFELPETPILHILATNVSEGCLCSFNRNGLLMMRRQSRHTFRINRIHTGLATIPMAVTASSAFPGFFPPIELTGADVGASDGEFGRQVFTDGGVFDNLGVRMFRMLQRPLLTESRLSRDDFVDFASLVEAFRQVNESGADTPLRRLGQILVASSRRTEPQLLVDTTTNGAGGGRGEEMLVHMLDHALRHHPLQHEPQFAGLPMASAEVEALLRRASEPSQGNLEADDQLWLNRHLFEAAYRKATGNACFCRLNSGLDGVIVSDVGKPFEVESERRAGGMIRMAMRATDILMDRVWQLENETFGDADGFVFARTTDVVDPSEDPTAPFPEIQRQAAQVRTDLDAFTFLEISALIRHGYCVGRKVCRAHPDLFGTDLPATPPWDPTPGPRTSVAVPASITDKKPEGPRREPSPVTAEARKLQKSSSRRIWSALLDYRDWTSYIYVPLIVPLLFLAPYAIVRFYQHSHRVNSLIESLSQGSPDLLIINKLLDGPMPPWVGETPEEVPKFDERNFTGFEVLQDSRIVDLRPWNPTTSDDPRSIVYGYRRLKIRRLEEPTGNTMFRIGLLATSPKTQVRFPLQDLRPKLRVMNEVGAGGEKKNRYEVSIDLKKVAVGSTVDLVYEHYSPGDFLHRYDNATTVTFHMEANTAEVTRWFFMPAGKEYQKFRIYQFPADKPDKSEVIRPVTEYLADDATILAYKLLLVKGGYGHEVQWRYKY